MKKNLKDWITSLVGLAIWIMTGVMIYLGKATWLWDGVTGFIVGGTFFLLPDDFLARLLKKFLAKKVE